MTKAELYGEKENGRFAHSSSLQVWSREAADLPADPLKPLSNGPMSAASPNPAAGLAAIATAGGLGSSPFDCQALSATDARNCLLKKQRKIRGHQQHVNVQKATSLLLTQNSTK